MEEHGVMADKDSSSTGRPQPASVSTRAEATGHPHGPRLVRAGRGALRPGGPASRTTGHRPGVLRKWVHQAEVDRGQRAVTTTEERNASELERENRELCRANEILKWASAFFAAELDRPSKR